MVSKTTSARTSTRRAAPCAPTSFGRRPKGDIPVSYSTRRSPGDSADPSHRGALRRTRYVGGGAGDLSRVEPAGAAFAYDDAGSARGNELKTTKPLASYDDDARAALGFLGRTRAARGGSASSASASGGTSRFAPR